MLPLWLKKTSTIMSMICRKLTFVLLLGSCALVAYLMRFDRSVLRKSSHWRVDNEPAERVHHPGTSDTSDSRWNVTLVHLNGVRLGNQLFQLASLCGIAGENGRHLQLTPPLRRELSAVFPRVSSLPAVSRRLAKTYRRLGETKGFAVYNDQLLNLPRENIQISGYLQSWRYFTAHEEEVRALLEFKPEIAAAASQFFATLMRRLTPGHVTLVGVHVRRGDIVTRPWLRVPGRMYIVNAMTYFRRQFPDVHFVLCSDDITWCEKELGVLPNVTVSKGNRPEVDLAILAGCRHAVMTVGTFGWWGAWLSGGQVVYYPTPSVEGTARAKRFKASDYFPPHWIPGSGE